MPKTLGIDDMREAIKRVLGGGVWTPPDVDLTGGADAESAALMARLADLVRGSGRSVSLATAMTRTGDLHATRTADTEIYYMAGRQLASLSDAQQAAGAVSLDAIYSDPLQAITLTA